MFSNVMKKKFAQTMTLLAVREDEKCGVLMPAFFSWD